MKKHIYNAGPLFTKGEMKERLEEDVKLQELKDYTFYNPITAPCNDKAKLPTSADIFHGDTNEVLKSDVVIANLDHEDPGVMAELGIAWGLNYAAKALEKLALEGAIPNGAYKKLREEFGIKEKEVLAVAYDLREGTAGEYNGIHIPFGRNQFVIGMLEDFEKGAIVDSFDDAISRL